MEVKAVFETSKLKSQRGLSYLKHRRAELDTFNGRCKPQEYVLYLIHDVLKCDESCS